MKCENRKIKVEIYSKYDCHLCDVVKATILKVKQDVEFELHEIDIKTEGSVFEEYKEQIPVVFINGEKAFKYKLDENEFRKKLTSLL